MKYLVIPIFAAFFLTACNGETKTENSNATATTASVSDHAATIKAQVELMRKALLAKDYKAFAKYTYPKVIQLMGGEEKMISILETSIRDMEAGGMAIVDVTVGEPSVIIVKENELQCTLPQTIEMKMPEGKMSTKSTLIAISDDNGKNWHFVDTSGKDINKMREMLPNLSPELVIAKAEEPVFAKE